MWIRTDNGYDVNLRHAVAVWIVRENVTSYTKDGKPFTETYFKVKVRMSNDSLFTIKAFKDPVQATCYKDKLVEMIKASEQTLLEHLKLIARCINFEQAVEEGA